MNWTRPDTTIRAMADGGYNVIIMAFYMSSSGASDFFGAWTTAITDAQRAAAVAYAHSKGALVFMSVGGATDTTWPTKNATEFGQQVGQVALAMQLDGVDFDLEVRDLPGNSSQRATGEASCCYCSRNSPVRCFCVLPALLLRHQQAVSAVRSHHDLLLLPCACCRT